MRLLCSGLTKVDSRNGRSDGFGMWTEGGVRQMWWLKEREIKSDS